MRMEISAGIANLEAEANMSKGTDCHNLKVELRAFPPPEGGFFPHAKGHRAEDCSRKEYPKTPKFKEAATGFMIRNNKEIKKKTDVLWTVADGKLTVKG
jgi:hypothetical protein